MCARAGAGGGGWQRAVCHHRDRHRLGKPVRRSCLGGAGARVHRRGAARRRAYALRRPPFTRFGWLLIGGGAGWFLTTLANAREPVPYSIGRVTGWAVEPLLAYLVLAFPTGRLTTRIDRVLVWAMFALLAGLYLPTALLVARYPVPVPWTSCVASCPGNAFMLVHSEPALIDAVVRPVRKLLTLVLFGAVTLRLAYRLHLSTRPVRRTLGPVLAVACFRWAAYVVALVGRKVAPDSVIVQASLWLVAITLPIIAIAFLVGARTLVDVHRGLDAATGRPAARPSGSGRAAQRARRRLRRPQPDRHHRQGDDYGYWTAATEERRIKPGSRRSRRVLTQVRDGDELVAAIIHDAALASDPAFIDTVTSYALMTLDNHRLSVETASLLREAQESRARIQAAADDERRRIERDLHDGAQQRLIALRIRLEVAAERTGNGDREAAAVLRAFGGDVDAALEEAGRWRAGSIPRSSSSTAWSRDCAPRCGGLQLPTRVVGAEVHRYSSAIESAAYFVCVEALQNATKRAPPRRDRRSGGALRQRRTPCSRYATTAGASTRRPWAPAPGS